jgi:beta-galactosidase
VAINDRTVVDDLDIFAEAGFGKALVRSVTAEVTDGTIRIGFPEVKAGQAIVAGIAIVPIGGRKGAEFPEQALTSDLVAQLDGPDVALDRFVDNGRKAMGEARWTRLPYMLLDSDAIRRTGSSGAVTLTPRVDVRLYQARTGDSVPAGWQPTDYRAGMILPATGVLTPVSFVERQLKAGQQITFSSDLPVLVRRALSSPYAPGNFSFAKDRTLFEAEAEGVAIRGGQVANALRGHSGPGYVQLDGKAAGEVSWTVETGAAARRKATIRYQAGTLRNGELVLVDVSGIAVVRMPVRFPAAGDWSDISIETPGFVNAGTYRLVLQLPAGSVVAVDSLRFE